MAEGGPGDFRSGDSEDSVVVSVETKNKFDALSDTHETMETDGTIEGSDVREERGGKRKRINTGSIGEDDFRRMSQEDQMYVMFSKLINIEQKQSHMEKIERVGQYNSTELNSLKKTAAAHKDTLNFLSYKSIDLEARSRRKNLIFRGLSESKGEDCYEKIMDFLYTELQFEQEHFVIDRAHRVGRRNRKNFLRRPIIVAFRDYYDVERIIERAYVLRGTRFGVDRDYPREINNARRLLWNRYKEIRQTKRRNDTVSLQFPAKIVVNGNVVEDAFPGWNEALKKVRVEPFVSQNVKAANERAKNESATGDQRPSYMQAGTDGSLYTGRSETADNENIAVYQSERSDQDTYTQPHDYNTRNNSSGSNSSDDEDDRNFYTNYVSRMQNPQHSERIDKSSSTRSSDSTNVNFGTWRDPNQPNNQPFNLSMRDYPPLTRPAVQVNPNNGQSAIHSNGTKHNGQTGYSGNNGGETALKNVLNERVQQSRDVGAGNRDPK